MSDHDLDQLMLLLDGELSPSEEVLVRARIEDEPELAGHWRGLQLMQGALQEELKAELRPDFTHQVMQAARQAEQIPPSLIDRFLNFLSKPIAVPLAAAAAVSSTRSPNRRLGYQSIFSLPRRLSFNPCAFAYPSAVMTYLRERLS